MSKIYIWTAECAWGDDVAAYAMTETGEVVAGHISSNNGWAHRDMIDSGWKDEAYKAAYPNGYELVWLGSDPDKDAGWVAAFELNKAAQDEAKTDVQA